MERAEAPEHRNETLAPLLLSALEKKLLSMSLFN